MLIIQRATNSLEMKPNNNWSESAFTFEVYKRDYSGKILVTHYDYVLPDRRESRARAEEVFLYTDGDIT